MGPAPYTHMACQDARHGPVHGPQCLVHRRAQVLHVPGMGTGRGGGVGGGNGRHAAPRRPPRAPRGLLPHPAHLTNPLQNLSCNKARTKLVAASKSAMSSGLIEAVPLSLGTGNTRAWPLALGERGAGAPGCPLTMGLYRATGAMGLLATCVGGRSTRCSIHHRLAGGTALHGRTARKLGSPGQPVRSSTPSQPRTGITLPNFGLIGDTRMS